MSQELVLPNDCVSFELSQLVFRRPPTWEEWQQVMVYLKAVRHVGLMWLADARKVGRLEFGAEAAEEFEQQLEFELPDLRAAEALSALEARSDTLSAQHHWVVARKIKNNADEQARWLDLAKNEHLSPGELSASIEAGRVVRDEERRGRPCGMASIEGIRQLWVIWESQVGDWKSWPREKHERLFEELKPIWAAGDWLVEQLSQD